MPKNEGKRTQFILSIEKIYKRYRKYKYLPETYTLCQLKHKSAQPIAWPEPGNRGFSFRHYLSNYLCRALTIDFIILAEGFFF